jgi:AcrR family transcriptional regulator
LRSDARENRDRILAAAAQAFAEHGLSVSLIEIARRAGVGNATLHRNFTKEELVEELCVTGTPSGALSPSVP